MNSNSPHLIPNVICSLADFKDLSMHDQGLFLLSRLALLAPRGKTFWDVDVYRRKGDRLDPNGLVPGLPKWEVRRAIMHLFDYPWREIVRNGYPRYHDALNVFSGPIRIFVEHILRSNQFGAAGFVHSNAWSQFRPDDDGLFQK